MRLLLAALLAGLCLAFLNPGSERPGPTQAALAKSPTIAPGIWDFQVQVSSYGGPSGSLPLPIVPVLSVGHQGSSRVRILPLCRAGGRCGLLLSPVGFQLLDPGDDLAATPLIWLGPQPAQKGSAYPSWSSHGLPIGYQSCGPGNLFPPTASLSLRVTATGGGGSSRATKLSGTQSYALGQVCDGSGQPIGWRVIHLRLLGRPEPKKAQDRLTESGKAVSVLVSAVYRYQNRMEQLCSVLAARVPSLTGQLELPLARIVITVKACRQLASQIGQLAQQVAATVSTLYRAQPGSEYRIQLLQITQQLQQLDSAWSGTAQEVQGIAATGTIRAQLIRLGSAVEAGFFAVLDQLKHLTVLAPNPSPSTESSTAAGFGG